MLTDDLVEKMAKLGKQRSTPVPSGYPVNLSFELKMARIANLLKMPSIPKIPNVVGSSTKGLGDSVSASAKSFSASSLSPKSLSPKTNFKPIAAPKPKLPATASSIAPAKKLQGGSADWTASVKSAKVTEVDVFKLTRKQKDIQLWKDWKHSGHKPGALKPLMSALAPVIFSQTKMWKGQVPDYALDRTAQSLALKALYSYDPNKGAALNTHVTNGLRKISRTVYQNQDIIRLPEDKKLESQAIFKSTQALEDELGRTPSDMELADDLGWNVNKVRKSQGLGVNELVSSLDAGGLSLGDNGDSDRKLRDTIHYVYAGLPPTDQVIFEHSTGFSGKPRKTALQISKMVKMSPGQVHQRKKSIADMLKKVM